MEQRPTDSYMLLFKQKNSISIKVLCYIQSEKICVDVLQN